MLKTFGLRPRESLQKGCEMDTQQIKEAMQDVRNLGAAMELYEKGRVFWVEHFPDLKFDDLFSKISHPEITIEDVIVQEVIASGVSDPSHAAKMLMAVVVCQMGFG